jgi:hypothetical protein
MLAFTRRYPLGQKDSRAHDGQSQGLHCKDEILISRKASGIQLGEDHANDVLRWCAMRGDVLGLEDFLQTFVKGVVAHTFICLVLHTPLRSID